MGKKKQLRAVLEMFVRDINAAGGVIQYPNGTLIPEGAGDWPDLGETYRCACEELGVDMELAVWGAS